MGTIEPQNYPGVLTVQPLLMTTRLSRSFHSDRSDSLLESTPLIFSFPSVTRPEVSSLASSVTATPREQPDAGADVRGMMLPLARTRLAKKLTHYIRSIAPAYGIPVVHPCKIGLTAVTLVPRMPSPTWTARSQRRAMAPKGTQHPNRLLRLRGVELQTQSFAGHLTATSPVPADEISLQLPRPYPRRLISFPDDDSFAMKAIFYALAFPGQFMSTPNSALVGRLTIMLIQIPPSVTPDLWKAGSADSSVLPRPPVHLPNATTLRAWGRSCRSNNYGSKMTSFPQNPLRTPRPSNPVTYRLRLPDGLHLETFGPDPSPKEAGIADSGDGRNSFLLLGVWDTAVMLPQRLAGGSAQPQAQLPDHRWTGVVVTASHSPAIGNGAKIVERPQGRDARGGGQARRVEVGGSRVKECGIRE
ncbi:hypothetical protein NEUTE1DRAFT_98884 [Neurospora tetrasperma FGSC 2508]|uniref:Uncharacterized protein n=1 Tax=Neurospora tetrasperma (strain FGSC 2508 / ATCC MYA-4615 / P0657) TaxID=510951 RepID=F8MGM4_NEUT8|nr:uncharacterized protein NEUTE1DRAFT_98884 [Neurospora tetrasperma FGSC 2508]EGO58646.1 hypothetical protein NEUTE1DRAFT_98884 [Neurospora tetrasperma FGSC 2508]